MAQNPSVPTTYREILEECGKQVQNARMRAALAANSELVGLYLAMGRALLEQQRQEGWDAGVIGKLADDLRTAFPDMKEFSPRNLACMRQAAESAGEDQCLQQLAAKLPWGHIMVLIRSVRTNNARLWYGQQAMEHGWSRAILAMQIESRLYERQAGSLRVGTIREQLPSPQSDMAREILGDPSIFDFLSVEEQAQERESKQEPDKHITAFLLGLGTGFSYVGRQVHLEVAGEGFLLDLLFYHLRLRCYVVIEVEPGEFRNEYVEKLNLCCSAVDRKLRHEQDNQTI